MLSKKCLQALFLLWAAELSTAAPYPSDDPHLEAIPIYDVPDQVMSVASVGGISVAATTPTVTAKKWLASLGYISSSTYKHMCAAVFISPTWAMTAARCVVPSAIKTDILRTGALTLTKAYTDYAIVDFAIHPAYDKTSGRHDIALLQISGSNPGPLVKLPSLTGAAVSEAPGNVLNVLAWGYFTTSSPASAGTLQLAQVPVSNQSVCSAAYIDSGIFPGQVCAGVTPGAPTACQGYGGAAMYKGTDTDATILGMGSWAAGCKEGAFYGVFTRVSQYLEWMSSVTATQVDLGPSSGYLRRSWRDDLKCGWMWRTADGNRALCPPGQCCVGNSCSTAACSTRSDDSRYIVSPPGGNVVLDQPIVWRNDFRCGAGFPLGNGAPSECNPGNSNAYCCSALGYCSATKDACYGPNTFNYRQYW
eukprot:comp21644_c0_seq1/m.30416 comp21644_c0_seq1/g.30416  ORF comp21644_c0_seq1/g.30416 comp21644_c0_seq1/m.30416 type:complete len:419 (-) comp21644_c0_seq1:245-1501(-)